jgi:hypothetical protein
MDVKEVQNGTFYFAQMEVTCTIWWSKNIF